MVAPPLLADVAQGVLAAALVELVEHEDPGEVEHVDLLELARGAVLRRHHVERDVDEVDDRGVALADPGRLDDDEIEALRRACSATASSRTALVAALRRRVASERMNTRPSRRLFILIRSPSSAPPVRRRVGSTASTAIRASGKYWRKRETSSSVTVLLPAPPVPVMPTTGTAAPAAVHSRAEPVARRLGHDLVLERRERPGDRQIGRWRRLGRERRELLDARGALDQVGDHPLEAELLAVAREVDALDPVRLELGRLARGDRAAAAAEDADVPGALLAQHVDRVLEVLEVAALVGADRDPVGVLLDRGAHDVARRCGCGRGG